MDKKDTIRTSVVLDRDLHTRAKVYAAQHRVDLNDLLIEGLKLRLAQKGGK